MSATTTWLINGYTFDPETPDGDQDILAIDYVDGWDAPEVDVFQHDGVSDGDWISHARLTSYALTVEGHAFTPDRGNHTRLKNKLIDAFSAYLTTDTLIKYHDEGNESLAVRRNGPIGFTHSGPHVVEFQVPMISIATTKTVVP